MDWGGGRGEGMGGAGKNKQLWVKSRISDGDKSNRERIHSLPESARLPGLIIQHNLTFSLSRAVIFQQNKRERQGESPNI